MHTPFRDGFPKRWRSQLQEFAEQASQDLTIDSPTFAYEEVVTRLAEHVSNDVRVVCVFQKPEVLEFQTDEGIETDIHLPLNPTAKDTVILASDLINLLETKEASPPEALSAKMRTSFFYHDGQIERLSTYLLDRYGKDASTLAFLIAARTEVDLAEAQGWRLHLEDIPDYDEKQHDETFINLVFSSSPKDGTYNNDDTFALGHFSEFMFRNRLMSHETFDDVAQVLERLLATKKEARKKARLLLQNYRHKPQDVLVHLIAMKGYETLLQMPAMTDFDIWEKLAREQLRTADLACIKCTGTEKMDKANEVTLKEGDPGTLRYLDNENEREVWRKAHAYLSTHEPEPQVRIIDKLPVEKYRAELKKLADTYQWDALGAKEREIINTIFSEVVRIGYAYAEEEDRSHDSISFKTGTPEYAVRNQRLTCFTGPWLIAALCLECGIPYEKLYFCNVNNNHDNAQASSHGALLMRYSDGTMGFIDYSYKRSSRPFSTQLIEKKSDVKKLLRLFETADGWAQNYFKIPGDPVHVSVDFDVAKQNHLYQDMQILPLDQGFAATQLLHTGLSFREEGRMDEALEAFELGLTFFPTDPDLLCQCAIIHYERSDVDRAEWLVDLALSSFSNHMLSLFQKAKICHVRGNMDDAITLFNRIGFDQREMWGDTSVKAQANRYCMNHQFKILPLVTEELIQVLERGRSILTRCEDKLL